MQAIEAAIRGEVSVTPLQVLHERLRAARVPVEPAPDDVVVPAAVAGA